MFLPERPHRHRTGSISNNESYCSFSTQLQTKSIVQMESHVLAGGSSRQMDHHLQSQNQQGSSKGRWWLAKNPNSRDRSLRWAFPPDRILTPQGSEARVGSHDDRLLNDDQCSWPLFHDVTFPGGRHPGSRLERNRIYFRYFFLMFWN